MTPPALALTPLLAASQGCLDAVLVARAESGSHLNFRYFAGQREATAEVATLLGRDCGGGPPGTVQLEQTQGTAPDHGSAAIAQALAPHWARPLTVRESTLLVLDGQGRAGCQVAEGGLLALQEGSQTQHFEAEVLASDGRLARVRFSTSAPGGSEVAQLLKSARQGAKGELPQLALGYDAQGHLLAHTGAALQLDPVSQKLKAGHFSVICVAERQDKNTPSGVASYLTVELLNLPDVGVAQATRAAAALLGRSPKDLRVSGESVPTIRMHGGGFDCALELKQQLRAALEPVRVVRGPALKMPALEKAARETPGQELAR